MITKILSAAIICASLSAQWDYYVAPNGNSGNNGTTINTPWPLEHAIANVPTNKVVRVAAGIYTASDTLSFSIANRTWDGDGGTVVIQGTGWESAVDSNDWTAVSGSNNVWETAYTASSSADPILYGRIGEVGLAPYYSTSAVSARYTHLNASSSNYSTTSSGYYCGPGCCLVSSSGIKARIRLTREHQIRKWENTTSLQAFPPTSGSTTDPNNYVIRLYHMPVLIELQNGADGQKFYDITFRDAEKLVEIQSNCDNIEFGLCTFDFGRYGLTTQPDSSGVTNSGLLFDECTFNQHVPRWFPRSDVKAADGDHGPLKEGWQGAGVELHEEGAAGTVSDVEFVGCTFTDCFDGIDSYNDTNDLEVDDCTFTYIRDDCIELSTAGHNYKIGMNTFKSVNSAIAYEGEGDPTVFGDIFIGGNVIDQDIRLNYARNDEDVTSPISEQGEAITPTAFYNQGWLGPNDYGWGINSPFETHGTASNKMVWKVYHNTFLCLKPNNSSGGSGGTQVGLRLQFKGSDFAGTQATGSGGTGGHREVYFNNLIYLREDFHCHVGLICTETTTSNGEQDPHNFDGNLYHYAVTQTNGKIWKTAIANGLSNADYTLRSDFIHVTNGVHWAATVRNYAAKWESAGVQGNPQISLSTYIPSTSGSANGNGLDMSSFTSYYRIGELYNVDALYIGAKFPQ